MNWLAIIVPLLVESGIAQEAAEAVALALRALVQRLAAAQISPSTLSVAQQIIEGVDRDHPDWDADTKARTAAAAIRWHWESELARPIGRMDADNVRQLVLSRLREERA